MNLSFMNTCKYFYSDSVVYYFDYALLTMEKLLVRLKKVFNII